MVQMDNFCLFASVFMMGKPAFLPNTLTLRSDGLIFSEPFYVSQTFIFKCGQRCGAADIVCRQPVGRRGRIQMVRPVFAIRQPAGHVHQPPAAHVCDCTDGCVDGSGRHDYADFDAQPFCRTVDGGRKSKRGFGFAVDDPAASGRATAGKNVGCRHCRTDRDVGLYAADPPPAADRAIDGASGRDYFWRCD